jgi:hypothetical protein
MRIGETKSIGAILIWYPRKKREAIRKALLLLAKAKFLKLKSYPYGSCEVEKLRNIPPQLKWKEAKQIARNPWMLWFKFPEDTLKEQTNEKS